MKTLTSLTATLMVATMLYAASAANAQIVVDGSPMKGTAVAKGNTFCFTRDVAATTPAKVAVPTKKADCVKKIVAPAKQPVVLPAVVPAANPLAGAIGKWEGKLEVGGAVTVNVVKDAALTAAETAKANAEANAANAQATAEQARAYKFSQEGEFYGAQTVGHNQENVVYGYEHRMVLSRAQDPNFLEKGANGIRRWTGSVFQFVLSPVGGLFDGINHNVDGQQPLNDRLNALGSAATGAGAVMIGTAALDGKFQSKISQSQHQGQCQTQINNGWVPTE